jgi:phosphoglycolate phosphatase
LRNSEIEIINPIENLGRIRFAIFDFDGTISLIRSGWQEIMIPMMVEILLETPEHEGKIEIEKIVNDYVALTTGKQTIYQMIRLAEEVEKRGGHPKDPLHYKNQYHDQLMSHINNRVEGLRLGSQLPEDWVVPGALGILEVMKNLGVSCFPGFGNG